VRAAAVIPARAGSKGLPDKNALPVAGVPMVVRAITAVASAGSAVERILVSTDSPAVARLAEEAGAVVVERPAELASDTAGVESAARHALRSAWPGGDVPELTLIVQPNLPVWQPGIVAEVLGRLERGDCTAAATCFLVDQRPEWMKRLDADGYARPFLPAERVAIRRQDMPEIYYFDGAVLGVRTEVLLASEGQPVSHLYFLGDRVAPVPRPEIYGMEVHSPGDVLRAEATIAHLEQVGYPR
jgi:CMP-N,N'-diacetyllegionaminic acid synthase